MGIDTSNLPPIPDGFQIQSSTPDSGSSTLPPIPDGFQLKDKPQNSSDINVKNFEQGVNDVGNLASQGLLKTITGKGFQDRAIENNVPEIPTPTKAPFDSNIEPARKNEFGTILKAGGAGLEGQLQDIATSPASLASPAIKGVGIAKEAVGKAVSDFGSKNLENRIFGLYNSSVGAKAKNLGDVTKVQPQRMTALKTMSDNIPNVTLESGEEFPKNRWDLAQTLKQTKQSIWDKVSKLSGGATDAGAQIPMAPVVQKAVNDTIKGIGSDALKANPNLLRSLEQEATNVSNIGTTTPSRAQVYMSSLNKELSPIYNAGKGTDYSVLDFKRNLVNHLNDATESAIEDTLNKSGYGDLRDQYAALKSSEKEIVGAANKYLRQQGGQGGGIAHPIVNLWSIEQMMEAGGHVLSGNPAGAVGNLVRAALIKRASKIADFMKNPDNKISTMFDLLKKYKGGSVPTAAAETESSAINPEVLGNRRYMSSNSPAGLPAPANRMGLPDKSIQMGPAGRSGSSTASGYNAGELPNPGAIKQPGYVPRGLPEPFQGRSGVDRPYENRGLPSPHKAGVDQTGSGATIKQGTSYKAPVKPLVDSSPKYGSTGAKKLYAQGHELNEVPLHPAKEAKAELGQIFSKGDRENIARSIGVHPDKVDSLKNISDYFSNVEPGGKGFKSTDKSGESTFWGKKSDYPKFVQAYGPGNTKDLIDKVLKGKEPSSFQKAFLKRLLDHYEGDL